MRGSITEAEHLEEKGKEEERIPAAIAREQSPHAGGDRTVGAVATPSPLVCFVPAFPRLFYIFPGGLAWHDLILPLTLIRVCVRVAIDLRTHGLFISSGLVGLAVPGLDWSVPQQFSPAWYHV